MYVDNNNLDLAGVGSMSCMSKGPMTGVAFFSRTCSHAEHIDVCGFVVHDNKFCVANG